MTSMKRGDSLALVIRIRQLVDFAIQSLENNGLLILPDGVSNAEDSLTMLNTVLEVLDDYQKRLPITPTSVREAHTNVLVE